MAGELSDIVESFAVGGAGPAAGAHQGETSAQTPGAEQGCGAGLPVKKESSPASYSDQVDEEEEEEEEITADQEVKPDKKEEQSEEKTSKQEVQAETPQRDQHAREVKAASAHTAGVLLNPASIRKGQIDPHYLSRALQLRPCGKASARADRGGNARSRERTPRGRDHSRDGPRSRARGGTGAEASGGHRHYGGGDSVEDRSPERPPIVRRPQDPREWRQQNRPKKKKANKGQKRRDRGREFRARRGEPRRGYNKW